MSDDNQKTDTTQLTEAENAKLKEIADAAIKKDGQTLVWPNCPKWPSNFKAPGSDLKHAQSTGGSSASVVYGNFYKYMDGDSFVSTDGNSWSQTVGNSFSLSCGASESFKLSNDFSATMGGSESVTLGALNMSFTGTAAKLGVTYTAFEAAFSAAKAKFEITKAPKVYGLHEGKVIETAALGLSYTAATGGIKFNAGEGGIKSIAGEGDITNTAATGNITNNAAKNIENISAAGDIISKAVTGEVVLEALNGITLKCGTNSITISPTGIEISSSANIEMHVNETNGIVVNTTSATIAAGSSSLKAEAAMITATSPTCRIG